MNPYNNQHEPEQQNDVNEWIRFGLRLGVSAALHPLEYSKVLIQLGYEPQPPRPGRTLFGQRALIYPNIFQYAGYIRRIDGLSGCYRGLTPKLIGNICGVFLSEKIAVKLGMELEDESKDETDLTDEELYEKFQKHLKRDMVIHISGIIITQPFHVISLRMMAQFIGREETYKSVLGSIVEIYRNDGICGFFAGIIPKLICDLACLILSSTTVYLVNKHFINDKENRKYFASFTQFAYSSILYPLQVVSSCMSVSGSGLSAGKLPNMPVYKNWVDCWNDLQARGELKRGSSLFWRSSKSKSAFNRHNFAPMPAISGY